MPIITENFDLPAGQEPTLLHVTLDIVGTNGAPIGEAYTSGSTIISSYSVDLDASGGWSLNLTPNTSITPSGTAWRRQLKDLHNATLSTSYATVGASAANWKNILTTAPASVLPSGAAPAAAGVPTGGTTNQVLAKLSNADFVTGWVAQTGGGGGGGTVASVVAGANIAVNSADPANPVVGVTGLASVATLGTYASLTGKPTYATVATSGLYSDLGGLPTLGTVAALASDTDVALAANLDTKVATQKATKAYADTKIAKSIGAAKGDLVGFTAAGTPSNLGVGSDTFVLTADTASALGFKWAAATGGGGLQAANNLSDVANVVTARANLNLGSAALVADATLIHTTGNESMAGTKTFTGQIGLTGGTSVLVPLNIAHNDVTANVASFKGINMTNTTQLSAIAGAQAYGLYAQPVIHIQGNISSGNGIQGLRFAPTTTEDGVGGYTLNHLDMIYLQFATGITTISEINFLKAVAIGTPANATNWYGVQLDFGNQAFTGTAIGLKIKSMNGSTNWGMQIDDVPSYHVGKHAFGGSTNPQYAIDLQGTAQDRGVIAFVESVATPTNPAASAQCVAYMKADKFIIAYNDAGTMRYKYLDLTGTGVTWVHATVAP